MGDMNESTSQDWLDQLVQQVGAAHPTGRIVVSSGHSPSGVYHIGTLREIMTASAITWALREAGYDAWHLDVVDDFDAFRKVPAGVPESWKQYIGTPLALVPDPGDCHPNYGAHYLAELRDGLAALGAMPDEQISGYENYQSGLLEAELRIALDHIGEVREILAEVGGRQLDESWAPVQILSDAGSLREWKYAGWNPDTGMVVWRDRDGHTGEVPVASGRVKLDWRLDWPARWAHMAVNVEPFGRDHATKGGSYQTGAVLVDKIFGGSAPYPVPYEFINSAGETKKMSKSSGNVLTPRQALDVMPAEILRYFVIHARPARTLVFDSGMGLYALIDEYAKAQAAEAPSAAMRYAKGGQGDHVISSVPFNHLVAVYQAARHQPAAVREILERTGYELAVQDEWPVIERELTFVKNWLERYAPESVKFEVQSGVPEYEFSSDQLAFLNHLADTIERESDLNAQGIHDSIYAAAEVAGVKPGQAFVAVYQVLLGQDKGPKAGWFLASLDQTFLLNRLRRKA